MLIQTEVCVFRDCSDCGGLVLWPLRGLMGPSCQSLERKCRSKRLWASSLGHWGGLEHTPLSCLCTALSGTTLLSSVASSHTFNWTGLWYQQGHEAGGHICPDEDRAIFPSWQCLPIPLDLCLKMSWQTCPPGGYLSYGCGWDAPCILGTQRFVSK